MEKQALRLEEVEENLDEPIEDLKSMLDGLVIMGKIAKSGKQYHGLTVTPEKRTTSRSVSIDDYDYPDWVETKKDQLSFWLAEGAPLLPHSKAFIWWDYVDSNTGKIIYDALHNSSVKHEYTLRPRPDGKGNEVQYKDVHSTCRGISFGVVEGGVFNVSWWDSKSAKTELNFNSYEELRKWTLQNI